MDFVYFSLNKKTFISQKFSFSILNICDGYILSYFCGLALQVLLTLL